MADVLARVAVKLVADEFKGQRDPYGDAWAPFSPNTRRRRRGSMGRAKLLQDTGRMRASIHVRGTPEGLRISIPVEYAGAHQYGADIAPRSRVQTIWQHPETGKFVGRRTKLTAVVEHTVKISTGTIHIPRRAMLPMDSMGGIGPIWGPALRREIAAWFNRQLRGVHGRVMHGWGGATSG